MKRMVQVTQHVEVKLKAEEITCDWCQKEKAPYVTPSVEEVVALRQRDAARSPNLAGWAVFSVVGAGAPEYVGPECLAALVPFVASRRG